MDRLSKTERSRNMARIRSRNTRPEKMVRSLLHRMGYRFRLHSKSLPGHPDVVLPRYHTVLFVHGCFWHRHRGCEYATTPKTRTHFWTEKFKANAVRDRRVIRELRQLEWHVLVVWECELRDVTALATRLDAKLRLQLDAVGSKF